MSTSRMTTRSTGTSGKEKEKARTNKKSGPSILSKSAEKIVERFQIHGEKDSTKNLKDLLQYPEIASRLVDYVNDPDIERNLTVKSFCKVKEDDILKMGVEIFPEVSFHSLARNIRRSSIAQDFNFADILAKIQSNPIHESFGERAFQSISESHARVGIHKIMSNIINEFQQQKAFLVQENVVISRLNSKVAPVEIQHTSDGVVNSTFLTGILDFLCCSSNIDQVPMFSRYRRKTAFDKWEESPVAPSCATWPKINELLPYIEAKGRVFDKLAGDVKIPPPRWQLLVIEAKCMEKRQGRPASETEKRDVPIQEFAPGLESEVRKLFILDPDHWLLAHKNLVTLLPFRRHNAMRQLDHTILDRYLYTVWHSSKNGGCQARYMPFLFLRDTGSSPDKSEIDRFRQLSGLPTSSKCRSCPLEPVVGVLQHNGQYSVVVVPHKSGSKDEEKRVFILGNTIEPSHSFRDSHLLGKGEWKWLLKIGQYHGWNMENYGVHHVAWHRDIEEDGGPIACEVTREIFRNGFSLKSNPRTCGCTHSIRLDILNTLHTSAIQNLARFPEVRRNKSSTPEYSRYFGSRLEELEERLETFWKQVSDHASKLGFVYISKELARGMAICQRCNINFNNREAGEDTHDDDEPDDDAEGAIEMREVENHLISESLAPKSSVRSLVDKIHQLDIFGSLPHLSAHESQSRKRDPDVKLKALPKQRSLKKHVYQVIAESLAMHFVPKPERFQEDVMKFCVSSSDDWLFGVIDCTHKDRPCYITDTLTHRFASGKNSTDFHDIVTLLLTWMCVPAEEILPYMKKT